MDNDTNNQVDPAAAAPDIDPETGKTRRLVLKMAGVGGVLGAAAAAGVAGMAAAGGSPGFSTQPVGGAVAAQYPIKGVASILGVKDAGAALEFFTNTFDAQVLLVARDTNGRIAHAEFMIDGTLLGVTNEDPNFGIVAPIAGATPNCESVIVASIEQVIQRVTGNGGTMLMSTVEVGDFMLHACFRDPFGHNWHLFEVLRPFSAEELQAAVERDIAEQSRSSY